MEAAPSPRGGKALDQGQITLRPEQEERASWTDSPEIWALWKWNVAGSPDGPLLSILNTVFFELNFLPPWTHYLLTSALQIRPEDRKQMMFLAGAWGLWPALFLTPSVVVSLRSFLAECSPSLTVHQEHQERRMGFKTSWEWCCGL